MGNELKPDAERAAWLADKIVALGDYAKEAAEMLRRWPSASDPVGEPVAVVVVHKDAPAEFFWTGNALTKGGKGGEVILPPGRHLLYASPLPQEPREATLTDEAEFAIEADGAFLASASGLRDEAWREIQHYAAQYAEEGPLTIYEVIRKPVATLNESADSREDH
jgi:hypothetical protein